MQRSVNWLTSATVLLVTFASVALGQSKFVGAFDKYKIAGDQSALRHELTDLVDRDCDLRVEVPALLAVLSGTNDPVIADFARGMLYVLAVRRRTEGDLFNAAIPIFERHLPSNDDNNRKETDRWEISIAMLEAIFGFKPSPRVLALMYKMTDYKYDPWAQGLAFEGLASLRTIPPEAKELFRSRMINTEGKLSGADLLAHLVPGLSDPDVLKMFLASAESQDVKEQRKAVVALANMSQIPADAVVVFRRLQLRTDLEESLATSVRGAIERFDHMPPK
jgi:hypothetical protein